MRPTFLNIRVVALNSDILQSIEVRNNFPVGVGVMLPRPLLRVDVLLGAVNMAVDKYIFVFRHKHNVDRFAFLSWNEVEMIVHG